LIGNSHTSAEREEESENMRGMQWPTLITEQKEKYTNLTRNESKVPNKQQTHITYREQRKHTDTE